MPELIGNRKDHVTGPIFMATWHITDPQFL